MSRYGLLLVAAGMLLAAALGAVAGARWASRRPTAAGPGAPAEEGSAQSTAARPRLAGLPRFVTSGADQPEEGSPATPARRSHRGRHARLVTSPGDQATPTLRSETGAEGPPPSAAAVTRAREVRAALEAAIAPHPGLRVRFADCSAGSCVARVESNEAAPLDKLLSDPRHLPPGFTARAHERLTAFNGRIYEADFVEVKRP